MLNKRSTTFRSLQKSIERAILDGELDAGLVLSAAEEAFRVVETTQDHTSEGWEDCADRLHEFAWGDFLGKEKGSE